MHFSFVKCFKINERNISHEKGKSCWTMIHALIELLTGKCLKAISNSQTLTQCLLMQQIFFQKLTSSQNFRHTFAYFQKPIQYFTVSVIFQQLLVWVSLLVVALVTSGLGEGQSSIKGHHNAYVSYGNQRALFEYREDTSFHWPLQLQKALIKRRFLKKQGQSRTVTVALIPVLLQQPPLLWLFNEPFSYHAASGQKAQVSIQGRAADFMFVKANYLGITGDDDAYDD